MTQFLFMCLLGHLFLNANAGAVSFIKPCKLDDKACLIVSAQAAVPFITDGVPDLGLPPLDPLKLDDVKADDGDLKLGFRDLTVTGLKNCKFTSMEFTSTTSPLKLVFDAECPISGTGKYTVGGKLLVVPVEGDGNFEIKTDKLKISIKAVIEKVEGADGKQHFTIVSLDKSYEPVEKAYFKFENLFNGDETKAKPVLDILDISWKELFLGVGQPIVYQFIDKAEDDINKFFAAVPADSLVLE